MQAKSLLASTLLILGASAQGADVVDASDIEAYVPTNIISPSQATNLANGVDSFVASVTADPAFSSVASVLATGVPQSALIALESNPESFLLSILTGTSVPSWLTNLPPSVTSYVLDLGRSAEALLSTEVPGLYSTLTAEAGALATGGSLPVPVGTLTGGFVGPTGGYTAGNVTVGPTGTPTGTPTGVVPGPPGPTFTGGASTAGVKVIGVVMGAAVGALAWM